MSIDQTVKVVDYHRVFEAFGRAYQVPNPFADGESWQEHFMRAGNPFQHHFRACGLEAQARGFVEGYTANTDRPPTLPLRIYAKMLISGDVRARVAGWNEGYRNGVTARQQLE